MRCSLNASQVPRLAVPRPPFPGVPLVLLPGVLGLALPFHLSCPCPGPGAHGAAMRGLSAPRPRSWSWGCPPPSPPPPAAGRRAWAWVWGEPVGLGRPQAAGRVGSGRLPSSLALLPLCLGKGEEEPPCLCCVGLAGAWAGAALSSCWWKMSSEQALCLCCLVLSYTAVCTLVAQGYWCTSSLRV